MHDQEISDENNSTTENLTSDNSVFDMHSMSDLGLIRSISNPVVPPLPPTRYPRSSPLALVPESALQSAIDLYFLFCHNQPYSFFHESTFRNDFEHGLVPEYLVLSILTMSIRFSYDPFFHGRQEQLTTEYALRAWNLVLQQCFSTEEGLDYHAVQAATLLAIHDFTGKHFISVPRK